MCPVIILWIYAKHIYLGLSAKQKYLGLSENSNSYSQGKTLNVSMNDFYICSENATLSLPIKPHWETLVLRNEHS